MTAVVEAEATEAAAPTEAKEPAKRGRKPESRDWNEVREDHISLAKYIQEKTGLSTTPNDVKAVFLLRGEWTNTPERVAEREAAQKLTEQEKAEKAEAKRIREAEKAKYANETPEEKAKRLEREKAIKAADRAAKRAAELQAKAEELRAAAESDSDGESEDPEADFAGVTDETPEVETEVAEVEAEEDEDEVEDDEAPAAKPARRPRKRTS